MKQYDAVLKRWWRFCDELQVNPYQASVPYILRFLSEWFETGASYGTLNTARSALSLINGAKSGSDDRLKRFFKGVFRLKPPTAKYNITWDPALVLNHLGCPNESLDLLTLTKKLVTILALTTAHRVQTLSLIKINNIKFITDGVHIKIPDIVKTSKKNSFQPILYLKNYSNKPEICPVNTLKAYLRATQQIRQKIEFLILTVKKPHSNASSQSISRWIKATLCEAGVDTSIFTAHSTRHASTSAANRAGLNIDLIRRTAGWSEHSATFARFYNRPVSQDPLSFSNTICNTIVT